MEAKKIIKINIYMILITAAFSPVIAYVFMGILFTVIILFKQGFNVLFNIKNNKILLILIGLVMFTSVISELWYISIFFGVIFIIKILFSQTVSIYFNDKDVRMIFIVVLACGIIVSIIGLLQLTRGNIEMPASWVDSSIYQVRFRVYSTFLNPNVFAGFLNLVIIASIIVMIYENKKAMKILGVLALSFSLICLLFTYSRGGWISLCLSLIIASLFERKLIKYCVILIALFLSFDYFSDVGRLMPDNILKDSSIKYRFEIWLSSIKIFLNNWLFGIGSGTSWYYVQQYSQVVNSYVRHAHNLYLQVLLDVGVIGFVFYSIFYYQIWHKIKSNLFNPSKKGILNTVSFIFYVSLLCFGLIDIVTSYLQLSIYVWFLIGTNNYIKKI